MRWIDLIAVERFSGFAVISLDCLLLEALVGFITGKPSKGPDQLLTGKIGGGAFGFTPDQAQQFRENVRNAIIHDSETRAGWIIRPGEAGGPLLTVLADEIVSLNRTAFHATILRELEDWLTKLRSGDQALRRNMRVRMNQIVKIHKETV